MLLCKSMTQTHLEQCILFQILCLEKCVVQLLLQLEVDVDKQDLQMDIACQTSQNHKQNINILLRTQALCRSKKKKASKTYCDSKSSLVFLSIDISLIKNSNYHQLKTLSFLMQSQKRYEEASKIRYGIHTRVR